MAKAYPVFFFRRPKTQNERKQNATFEHRHFVRAKRRPINLPSDWDDLVTCRDIDTRKQKRQSNRNYRQSIKFLPFEINNNISYSKWVK